MKARHRRFAWIAAGVAVLGIAVALVLNAVLRVCKEMNKHCEVGN